LDKVITRGILGWEMKENKEALLDMWLETPKSIIHGLWHSKVWEMQAFDKLVRGCA